MNDSLKSALNAMAQEIVALSMEITSHPEINPKGHPFREAILQKEELKESGGSVVMKFLLSDYALFLEKGRAPHSNPPPINELKKWAESKGIPADNGTLHAIAQKIARDGIKARPVLATLESAIEAYFDNGVYDRLLDAVMEEVNNLFT